MRHSLYGILYAILWPINAFLILTAWGVSPLVVVAVMWWYGALDLWLWALPLFLFSAGALAALSLIIGPKLPGVLRWFSTMNNTLDGGWNERISGFKDPATLNLFELWLQRTRWTYRNPSNGWQSQAYGVADPSKAFTFKRDLPLGGNRYLKLWLGWNTGKRGGDYFPYMFQCGLKRRD